MTDALAVRADAPAPSYLSGPRPAQAFHARITPHRSMSNGAMLIASLSIMAFSLALQVGFIVAGTWPVAAFLAFDTLVLLACLIGHHASRLRTEEVIVADDAVLIRRSRHDREMPVVRIPLDGLCVSTHADPDYGLQSITLIGRGFREVVAADLSPDERRSFHAALIRALWRAGASPRVDESHSLPLAA